MPDTALHKAAQRGDVPGVEHAINEGVDLEAKKMNELTALHLAAQRGDVPGVEHAINEGVDLESFPPSHLDRNSRACAKSLPPPLRIVPLAHL
eukprot:COSAG01_NODE_2326_length_7903_cov_22.624552_2_plen_93_part_00